MPRADAVPSAGRCSRSVSLAALIAAGVAGLLPALRASRPDRVHLAEGLAHQRGPRRAAAARRRGDDSDRADRGAARGRRAARPHRVNLQNVRPGYDTENVLAMTVTDVQRDQCKAFHTQALERVAAIPGVTPRGLRVGRAAHRQQVAGDIEIGRAHDRRPIEARRSHQRAAALDHARLLRRHGHAPCRGAAVPASRTTTRRRASPSSTRRWRAAISAGRPPSAGASTSRDRPTAARHRRDRRRHADRGLSAAAEPEIYLPFWQQGAFSKHLVLRTTRDPLSMAAPVRRELRAVDPTSARWSTSRRWRRSGVSRRRRARSRCGCSPGSPSPRRCWPLVGLYGVLSLSVARARRSSPCGRRLARRGTKSSGWSSAKGRA